MAQRFSSSRERITELMNPLDELDLLLDTLESIDEDYAGTHAAFALKLIENNSHSTAAVAALYLKWALSKKDIVLNGFKKPCQCDSGWLEGSDDGVLPCPRCRPDANTRWFAEFVDSSREPS